MQSSFQSRIEREEQLLEAYREERFQGSARVRLDCISFDHGFGHLMNDGRNAIRLERILEIQGCLRINRDYHVPVLVRAADWGHRIRFSETSSGRLPELVVPLDTALPAMNHESLISAARKWLSPQNRWWVVDVYVEDQEPETEENGVDRLGRRQLGARLVRSLREQFRNERQPPDGLIYQKIRLYEGALDQPADRNAANKWWAILQNNPATKKHKYLRTFLRHGSFPQAFDALLPIPGLWAGMQIGVLHTLVSLRCDEEILSYLEHIRHTFVVRVFGGDRELAAGADAASVLLLQSRVPKVSNRDLNFLQKRMNDGALFPSIHDSIQRDAVWSRLQTIDVPIPTLQTFFSDLRYLAVARRAMRALLHLTNPATKMSIDERLGAQHRMVGVLPLGEGKHVVRQGLRELWRFSFQYGLEMTGTARRQPRDRRTQEAASVVPDITAPVDRTRLWQHFFWLADHEGFSIPSVEEFGIRPMADPVLATPVNSPDVRGDDEPVARRRGIPFAHTVDADRSALSKAALEQIQELRSVTPALIRQAQFRAFFRHLGRETRDSPGVNPPATRTSTTPVGTFISEPTIPPNTTEDTIEDIIEDTTVDTTEQHDTSPVPPATAAGIAHLDNVEFDPFWDTGMDMWGNVLPPQKLRVHIRVPDCPERTINVPSDRDRVIGFLDGLRACGFVLDIGHIRGGEGAGIYEWHVGYPFDEVQATLNQEGVHYDVPSENRLKRRRRDPGPSIAQNTVDEAMAWINRQVQLSVVEEEI